MSRLKWVVFALSVIVVFLVGLIALIYPKIEAQYQADADVQRVEGLFEIADLLEAYYDLMGYYPFSDEVPQDRYGVVLIGSSEQIDGLAIPKEFIVFPVSD